MTNKMNLLNAITQAIEVEKFKIITLKCIGIDSYGDIWFEGERLYKNAMPATAEEIVTEIERCFEIEADEVIVKIGSITIDIDICYNYDIIEE